MKDFISGCRYKAKEFFVVPFQGKQYKKLFIEYQEKYMMSVKQIQALERRDSAISVNCRRLSEKFSEAESILEENKELKTKLTRVSKSFKEAVEELEKRAENQNKEMQISLELNKTVQLLKVSEIRRDNLQKKHQQLLSKYKIANIFDNVPTKHENVSRQQDNSALEKVKQQAPDLQQILDSKSSKRLVNVSTNTETNFNEFEKKLNLEMIVERVVNEGKLCIIENIKEFTKTEKESFLRTLMSFFSKTEDKMSQYLVKNKEESRVHPADIQYLERKLEQQEKNISLHIQNLISQNDNVERNANLKRDVMDREKIISELHEKIDRLEQERLHFEQKNKTLEGECLTLKSLLEKEEFNKEMMAKLLQENVSLKEDLQLKEEEIEYAEKKCIDYNEQLDIMLNDKQEIADILERKTKELVKAREKLIRLDSQRVCELNDQKEVLMKVQRSYTELQVEQSKTQRDLDATKRRLKEFDESPYGIRPSGIDYEPFSEERYQTLRNMVNKFK
jgi:hypothetical protein